MGAEASFNEIVDGRRAHPAVLVVDDNAANLELLRYLLTRHGYCVYPAASAEMAQEILQKILPEIILLDLQLPGMDGLTFTRMLKSDPRTSSIIILAVTAYAMKGDEARVIEAGCDGYVAKPIDTRRLPVLIAEHLQRRRTPSLER